MKYSIIIPVYNAEKTLSRCVDSVLCGIPKDAEIILINDGSKDGSARLCEEYKAKYSNIVYIDKPNGGVSAARNDGLDAACGKYILFVDSDDYVVENFYEILDSATESDFDAVYFSHTVIRNSNHNNFILKDFASTTPSKVTKKIGEGIYKKWINSPCSRLYKREILEKHNLRFLTTVSIGEDRLFNIIYALHIKSLMTDSRILYCVTVENQNSLSRSLRTDISQQSALIRPEIDNALSKIDVSNKHGATLYKTVREAVNFCSIRSIYSEAKRLRRRKLSLGMRLKLLHQWCSRMNGHHLKTPKNPYCFIITLPVRFHMVLFLDIMAWILNR